MAAPSDDLRAFIRSLPKTETHLHIEGALPVEMLQRHNPVAFPEDWEPIGWPPDYKYPDFKTFETYLLEHATQVFTSADQYHEAAKIILRRCADEGCRYVETSFHSGICNWLDIAGNDIVEGILAAAPAGMTVRVYTGMLRFDDSPEMMAVLNDTPNWEHLAGVDLHGPEPYPLMDWTIDIFRANREAGKVNKAHAGEFGPAGNVREVIEKLDVRRVEHGVRAVEDPEVVRLLLDREVTLDVCPISNVKLNVYDRMPDHSLRQLVDAGVRCTINTDDPFSFGNRLSDDFLAIANDQGFSRRELVQLVRNGWTVALMDEAHKQPFLDELDRIEAGLSD
ncbi:MAG: adenosine deaminase family protein [Opitutales bacterium]